MLEVSSNRSSDTDYPQRAQNICIACVSKGRAVLEGHDA